MGGLFNGGGTSGGGGGIIPANTILGNNTVAGAVSRALTVAQVNAMGIGGNKLLGAFLAITVAAGAVNNLNPGGGFPGSIGRLDIAPSAGNSNLTGLLAGADGQPLVITNTDAVNSLTLNSQNAGSSAANRFAGAADLILMPGGSVTLAYYAGSVNRWRIIP